jgi:putative hydrolase of the HAD superfamily
MIKTIIFDLGNVVLTNDWHDGKQEKFEEYSDFFDITYDDMERGWDAAWPQFSIGKMTEDEFWKIFLSTAGAKSIDIEKAKELWKKYQQPLDDMLNLLSKLKKNNYQLGALTTISKEWLDFKKEKFGLGNYFEAIVSSGYFGKGKPDKKVYQAILSKLDAKPESSAFIDDTPELLTPAIDLGMQAIQFKDHKQLVDELSNLGITI